LNSEMVGEGDWKLYEKRDDFTFLIVNFHFNSSNIPALPAYALYISQLIRFWDMDIS
jgi:hypothetical protein